MPDHVQWVGTCIELSRRALEEFDDSARTITYKTFLHRLGPGMVRELDEQFGTHPRVRDDWAVKFESGRWRGKPAVCMHHSGIHHIWLAPTRKSKHTHV